MNILALLTSHAQHVRHTHQSPEAIQSQQLKKFRRLISYAQKCSPYYRDIISARGITVENCVPEEFPALTKSLLMENFDSIVTDRRITREAVADFLGASTNPNELFKGRYTVVHTSGTSGEGGVFCLLPH